MFLERIASGCVFQAGTFPGVYKVRLESNPAPQGVPTPSILLVSTLPGRLPIQMDTVAIASCACGRSFTQLNAFTNHSCTCPQSKKRLSGALHQAKQRWAIRKRRRVAVDQPSSASELDPRSSCALGTAGLISDRELGSLRLEEVSN